MQLEVVKLEESISPELLPDILIVNDPQGKTKVIPEFQSASQTTRYIRIYPRIDAGIASSFRAHSLPSEATLDFTDAQTLGVGGHSHVFRARLSLPVPLTAKSRSGDVFVAAKTSLSDLQSHNMLRHEARFYAKAIPPHMCEDWTGHQFVADAIYDDGSTGVLPIAAVTPKFYGFYVPEHWNYRGMVSSIMLVEECGVPIDREELKAEERYAEGCIH